MLDPTTRGGLLESDRLVTLGQGLEKQGQDLELNLRGNPIQVDHDGVCRAIEGRERRCDLS